MRKEHRLPFNSSCEQGEEMTEGCDSCDVEEVEITKYDERSLCDLCASTLLGQDPQESVSRKDMAQAIHYLLRELRGKP